MTEIAIGKLMLKVAGGAAKQPEDLANRIAQQLAQAALPPVSQELGGLQVSVSAQAGEDDDSLAHRIAAQILRQLDALS
jgi:hypothetical protein